MEPSDIDPLPSAGGRPGVRFNFRFAWSYDVDQNDPSYDGRLDPWNTEEFDIDLYYEMFPDLSHEERDRLEEYYEARDYFDYDPLSEDVLDHARETDFDFVDNIPLEPTDHSESTGHFLEDNPFSDETTPMQDAKREFVVERFQPKKAEPAESSNGIQSTEEKQAANGKSGEAKKQEQQSGSGGFALSPQHANALKQLKISASQGMAKQIGSAQASSMVAAQSSALITTPGTTSAMVATAVQATLVLAVAYVAVTSTMYPDSSFAVGTTFANFISNRVAPANLTSESQSFLSLESTAEIDSTFTQNLSSGTPLVTETVDLVSSQTTTIGNIFATKATTEFTTQFSTPAQVESSTESIESTTILTGSPSTVLSVPPSALPTEPKSADPSASPSVRKGLRSIVRVRSDRGTRFSTRKGSRCGYSCRRVRGIWRGRSASRPKAVSDRHGPMACPRNRR